MAKPHNALVGLAELAAQGKTRKELAQHYGVCAQTVDRVARLRGIALKRKNKAEIKAEAKPKVESPRNLKILSMHRQGVNMTKIGAQMGVTRERVRQILKRHGITGRDAGAAKKAKKTEAALIAREARCMARHGMTLSAYTAASKAGHVAAYCQQRNTARHRGVDWKLSFGEWFSIWQESGKLHLRGRGVGHYVMSRACDSGGYVLGNVHIQLSTENNSEYMTKNACKRNANPGVYLMYPGLSQPWIAKVSKKYLGMFATEQEATDARNAYLAARPKVVRRKSSRLGAGLGYQRYGDKFKVVVAKRYIGLFGSEQEAIAARQQAVMQIAA